MSIFNEFRGFWGTGAELIERAKGLSKALGIKSEKLTERLIRYYAAEGVLDKPDRLGREAAYHFRHVLQLLIARRLVDEGVTLIAVSKFNLQKSTEELEQALQSPSKEVAAKVTEKYREALVTSKDLPDTKEVNKEDSFLELKKIQDSILRESKELERTKRLIQDMLKRLEQSQQEFYKRVEQERIEIREIALSSIERMTQMVERSSYQFEEQMAMFRKQMAVSQEEMIGVLNKQFDQRLLSK
jgi:DNA-binding transcriptional MerR regulator